ncbi:MAG: hypothetical protein ACRCXT_18910 [Paraclostridium sp.]
MITYNRLSNYIHRKMKSFGFYNTIREDGTILMLVVTEISKLDEDNRLNKDEKLIDIVMRLYDYCGYKNIKINKLEYHENSKCSDMIQCIVNEFESLRVDNNNGTYIKMCLELCYSYAYDNDINVTKSIIAKIKKLNIIMKSKRIRKL